MNSVPRKSRRWSLASAASFTVLLTAVWLSFAGFGKNGWAKQPAVGRQLRPHPVQAKPPIPALNVAVTITPDNAMVAPGGTVQFAASVSGTTNPGVNWSIDGNGTISASGLYSAGSGEFLVTVRATSVADPTKFAEAKVTVTTSQMSVVITAHGVPGFQIPTLIDTTEVISYDCDTDDEVDNNCSDVLHNDSAPPVSLGGCSKMIPSIQVPSPNVLSFFNNISLGPNFFQACPNGAPENASQSGSGLIGMNLTFSKTGKLKLEGDPQFSIVPSPAGRSYYLANLTDGGLIGTDYGTDSTTIPISSTGSMFFYLGFDAGGQQTYNDRMLTITFTPDLPPPPPLQIIGLEVTQGVQTLNNSVPLVEGKKTFFRVYVKDTSTGSVSSPPRAGATLTVTDNATGSVLATLTANNGGGTGRIDVQQTPVRYDIEDSFNFELPSLCTKGTLQFSFAGTNRTFVCAAGISNCPSLVATFLPKAPLSISLLPIKYVDGNGVTHAAPTTTDIDQTIAELLGGLPVPASTALVDISGPIARNFDPCDDAQQGALLSDVDQWHTDNCKPGHGPCREHYQALFTDVSRCPPTTHQGVGNQPGAASVAFVGSGTDVLVRLHEIGHNFGLEHTDVTHTEGCPCTLLEGNGKLGLSQDEYGLDSVFGFDVTNLTGAGISAGTPIQVYPPNTSDFMSYDHTDWISRVNYDLIFGQIPAPPKPPAGALTAPVNTVSANQTVIVGVIIRGNGTTGQFRSVIVEPTAADITLPTSGNYSIRLEDSNGVQLANYSFNPTAESEDASIALASLLLPWDSNAKRIVLLHNEQILDAREASPHAPIVNITSPAGGETLSGASAIFTWTATDADGDNLSYTVEYSFDNGATWTTLAINYDSESLPVSLDFLHGTSAALIRVTASDGFNCGYAQSQTNFTVPEHSPVARISSPITNRIYGGDQTVILEGTGSDIEDGQLDDSKLTWTSNLDGILGTGRSVVVNASTLHEGTHTITLGVSDTSNRVGSAAVAIQVFREPPSVPQTLSTAPVQSSFSIPVGQSATQIIAIRNSGDGDQLAWTATADQPWIHLDAATGSTPYNMSVTADATGLATGEYVGHVTINSSGAVGSPRVVTIQLTVSHATIVAVSRRSHGSAGNFDVPLPLTGSPGIECRTGGANGSYEVVATFSSSVTLTGASVTQGVGQVLGYSVSGSQITVDLTGVSNAQTIAITLFGVNDGGGVQDVSIPMGVLIGDTNADRFTDAIDTSQTKSKSGNAVNGSNFREDVNLDGFIDAIDVSLVKSQSGHALP